MKKNNPLGELVCYITENMYANLPGNSPLILSLIHHGRINIGAMVACCTLAKFVLNINRFANKNC